MYIYQKNHQAAVSADDPNQDVANQNLLNNNQNYPNDNLIHPAFVNQAQQINPHPHQLNHNSQ
jgi:hypothetical protein